MSKPTIDDFLVRPRAQELLALGVILRVGMAEVAEMERFAGTDLDHVYNTHFPMPDGQEWEVQLRKRT